MNTPAQQPSTIPRVDRSPYDRSPADRYLPLLFTASILLHELLLLWFMGSPSIPTKNSAADGNIPIEFVEVDPQQQVESNQTDSDRIGIGNSEAGEVIRSASLDAFPQEATATDSTAENSDFFQEDSLPQNNRERFQNTAEYARSQITPEQNTNPFQEEKVDRPEPKSPRSLVSPTGTESIPSNLPPGATEELFPSPIKQPPGRATSPQASGAGILGGKGQLGSQAENLLASSGRSSQNDRSGSGNGADARQDVDLAPYLANLKRQVESQWLPATGNQSSKVVVTFSISRSGSISKLSILTGSGRSDVDQAAIDAVQRAASSFGALPPDYSRNSLEIEFTFSITVEQPNVLY